MTVKISEPTINILKNYAAINSNLFVSEAGSVLATISPVKNVAAEATVAEHFPQSFGIWDLNKFLSVLSIFEEPELDFHEKHVTIRSGDSSAVYYYSAPALLSYPTKKMSEAKIPTVFITFDLNRKTLAEISKAASVMQLPDILVTRNDNDIVIQVVDKKDPTSNNFSRVVGQTDAKEKFKFYFRAQNLSILPGDYGVTICRETVSLFENKSVDVKYWIALESESKVG